MRCTLLACCLASADHPSRLASLAPQDDGESDSSAETADHFPCASISRSLKRWILPVAVFGRLSSTSIQRGYFHGPTVVFTCSRKASSSPSREGAPLSTM